ncbi:hypothetical protein A4R44_02595 [Amycolatopsis sp. M39]|nr:hypothetical protein A4R44_02595 [Amycolatopsis sp. M39]
MGFAEHCFEPGYHGFQLCRGGRPVVSSGRDSGQCRAKAEYHRVSRRPARSARSARLRPDCRSPRRLARGYCAGAARFGLALRPGSGGAGRLPRGLAQPPGERSPSTSPALAASRPARATERSRAPDPRFRLAPPRGVREPRLVARRSRRAHPRLTATVRPLRTGPARSGAVGRLSSGVCRAEFGRAVVEASGQHRQRIVLNVAGWRAPGFLEHLRGAFQQRDRLYRTPLRRLATRQIRPPGKGVRLTWGRRHRSTRARGPRSAVPRLTSPRS